ncbi:hypothetical protein JL2886_02488 [Phaeobacter gallaeciensis]|uniref:Uncharacterized protein n=1 Tax=Phaeobacter gallaeciensis TaxID=60890 RepID=A0A1B0ZT49_9RHOB|nr:hypothetical protein JL2886_02488 [Phaeobacter gallaeciensis]
MQIPAVQKVGEHRRQKAEKSDNRQDEIGQRKGHQHRKHKARLETLDAPSGIAIKQAGRAILLVVACQRSITRHALLIHRLSLRVSIRSLS